MDASKHKTLIYIAFIFVLIGLLGSCSGQEQRKRMAEASLSSVITVTSPDFSPARHAQTRWHSDLIWVDDNSDIHVADSEKPKLQKLLQSEMETKGYRFGGDDFVADYVFVSAVLLGEGQRKQELEELFKLYPALSDSQDYQKGTLMVAVVKPGQKQALWRGAIQLFAMGEDLPEPVRRLRVQAAVKKLLLSLPDAK